MRKLAMLFVFMIVLVCALSARAANVGEKETGLATVYTTTLSQHLTASGQRYDPSKLTAAHKTLPFGTKIRVTNPRNNKSVVVEVNDRGPMRKGRILDLSSAAAALLGIPLNTMRKVNLEVIELGSGKTTAQHAE